MEEKYPALSIQKTLYYSYLKDKDKNNYCIYKEINLKKNIDIEKLKKGLKVIFDKYKILKTKFITTINE